MESKVQAVGDSIVFGDDDDEGDTDKTESNKDTKQKVNESVIESVELSVSHVDVSL